MLFHQISYDKRTPLSVKVKQMSERPVNILSLDGGGTRGIALITMLQQIESQSGKKVKKWFQNIYGHDMGIV